MPSRKKQFYRASGQVSWPMIGLSQAEGAGLPYIYNFTPGPSGNLAHWYTARAAVQAGSGRAKVLFIGDSKYTGAGAGTTDAGTSGTSFTVGAAAFTKTKYLSDLLTAAGLSCSRESIVGSQGLNSLATLKNYDVRLTGGTNWVFSSGALLTLGGGALQLASANTDIIAFSPAGTVDTVDVLYIRGGTVGHFTVSDGVTQLVDVNGNGANALIRLSQALASRGSGKTINIARTTAVAQSVYIAAIIAYDSTIPAVEILNAGRFGTKTSDWVVTTNPWNSINAAVAYAPHVAFISLGANDLNTAVAEATTTANLQTMITALKNGGSDVVLVNQANGRRPDWGDATAQAGRLAADQTLALSNNIPLLNEDAVFGGYTGDSTKFADTVHENAVADALLAVPYANLLAA